jgi:UDP-N-acetylmuramoylalanine--D-glutamate ligase
MQLADKNIVIVGMGRTGIALARFLTRARASVVITDTADESALQSQLEVIKELGIKTELGKHRSKTFLDADLIVISPGVPHTIEPVRKARNRGVPVIGEIELASRFIDTPIVAVTGTNGKTTTTELIGAMLQSSGRRVFVGGNIGNPLISYADNHDPVDVVVAEISSFQLDTIENFRPGVSVLLNISADHLDRYSDMAAYIESKGRIFKNQQSGDIAVLNGSDPRVRGLSANLECKKLLYPAPLENEAGAMLRGDDIELIAKDTDIFDHLKLNGSPVRAASKGLLGKHNQENICAALLAALASGATLQGVRNALDQFQGSDHRLEHVTTINRIAFFNDSKATNVDAVDRALECFQQPVVLIMGGRDKGSNFTILQNRIRKHIKTLVVMGEAAEHIRGVFGEIATVINATSMQDAVSKAYQAAAPGDVVLLSPGCASFDSYENYGQRGDDFRRAVHALN